MRGRVVLGSASAQTSGVGVVGGIRARWRRARQRALAGFAICWPSTRSAAGIVSTCRESAHVAHREARAAFWCGGQVTVGLSGPGADALAESEAGLVSARGRVPQIATSGFAPARKSPMSASLAGSALLSAQASAATTRREISTLTREQVSLTSGIWL
jgi:hypothetical protein